MSNTTSLEQYVDNANVQAFLGMLRDAEGTSNGIDPYRVYGGSVTKQLDSLDTTPDFKKWGFTQTNGKANKSSATGAYQFLESTWKGLQKQYNFKDFSPHTQDLAAIALLKQNGALRFILEGDFDKAIARANKIWASLPGSPYSQKTRDISFVKNSLDKYLGVEMALPDQPDYTQPVSNEVSQNPKSKAPTHQVSVVGKIIRWLKDLTRYLPPTLKRD